MPCLAPFTSCFRPTKRLGISQGAVSSESQQHSLHSLQPGQTSLAESSRTTPVSSLHTTLIHILDNDSLLNIFHLYRPFLLGEDQHVNIRFQGGGRWAGERWWYRLAHVCHRWRSLILGSASYLGLCLVCTYGMPVADMLAHSPLLPLVIDYEYEGITAEEEEAIMLALGHRDRVRRIRFTLPVLTLQRLMMAIDGEYPILEYLLLEDLPKAKSTVLILPETLQTPHLRQLAIEGSIRIPLRSPLLGTAAGLVIFHLRSYHPSTYFQPTALLQWLSLMPQLEMLLIAFCFPVSNLDVESQLASTPIMTHVTFPNLRVFAFRAVSAYSEAVLSRVTAPRLEDFQICYPKELTTSVPHFLHFMGRTENLRFNRAEFYFYREDVSVEVYPPGAETEAFSMIVDCWHLDWQVSSVAQIFNALSQMFSTVEHLTVTLQEHSQSSEEHNEVDRAEWRKLLRSFRNVKTLRIYDGFVGEFSRSLRLEDGEHPLDLLPELQELTLSGSGNDNDAFTSFIDARQNAGRPITLVKS